MYTLLREIILESQELILFTGVARRIQVVPVANKATILIGVRRCGKSTWLHQVIEKLKAKGISGENILYLNFFDDRLSFLKDHGLNSILEAYYLLYPEKKNREKIYCFFDEIQVINGWESFVDRILREENCEVYITGSSSRMLSREIATQMRGRALTWEIFPFSFKEFLDYSKIASDSPHSIHQRLIIQHAFEQFWVTGGFPEVIGVDRFLRLKIHQEYFSSILFRDLVERYDISHSRALIDLARRLIDNSASMYSINSLTNFLKSSGHKVPKSTVSDYMTWFEDAFLLFTVRMYDASFNKSNANPKKIYCIDHSLIKSISPGILINSGHLLENMVFVALRRIYSEIYYYRTNKNQEIDFLVITQDRKKLLFQVAESLASTRTYQREIDSLNQAMLELGVKFAKIITKEESNEVVTEAGTFSILPVWRFLLEEN